MGIKIGTDEQRPEFLKQICTILFLFPIWRNLHYRVLQFTTNGTAYIKRVQTLPRQEREEGKKKERSEQTRLQILAKP
jgi:hypothetical protein